MTRVGIEPHNSSALHAGVITISLSSRNQYKFHSTLTVYKDRLCTNNNTCYIFKYFSQDIDPSSIFIIIMKAQTKSIFLYDDLKRFFYVKLKSG